MVKEKEVKLTRNTTKLRLEISRQLHKADE